MRSRTIYTLLLLPLLLSACVRSSQEYKALKAQYDSLAIVNERQETEAYHTDSLVASIITHFQELNHIENMINLNPVSGDRQLPERERIKANMLLLSNKLDESNKAIEQLTQELSSSKTHNRQLYHTITTLQEGVDRQRTRIETLVENSRRKIGAIETLELSIAHLRHQQERLQNYANGQLAYLKSKEDSLNTVYYALGTEGDLREMNLLVNGKVVVDNAEMDYLTRADKRQLTSIPMQSKTARLVTIHPRSSYRLTPDKKGYLTLEIQDPHEFWLYSQIALAIVE